MFNLIKLLGEDYTPYESYYLVTNDIYDMIKKETDIQTLYNLIWFTGNVIPEPKELKVEFKDTCIETINNFLNTNFKLIKAAYYNERYKSDIKSVSVSEYSGETLNVDTLLSLNKHFYHRSVDLSILLYHLKDIKKEYERVPYGSNIKISEEGLPVIDYMIDNNYIDFDLNLIYDLTTKPYIQSIKPEVVAKYFTKILSKMEYTEDTVKDFYTNLADIHRMEHYMINDGDGLYNILSSNQLLIAEARKFFKPKASRRKYDMSMKYLRILGNNFFKLFKLEKNIKTQLGQAVISYCCNSNDLIHALRYLEPEYLDRRMLDNKQLKSCITYYDIDREMAINILKVDYDVIMEKPDKLKENLLRNIDSIILFNIFVETSSDEIFDKYKDSIVKEMFTNIAKGEKLFTTNIIDDYEFTKTDRVKYIVNNLINELSRLYPNTASLKRIIKTVLYYYDFVRENIDVKDNTTLKQIIMEIRLEQK